MSAWSMMGCSAVGLGVWACIAAGETPGAPGSGRPAASRPVGAPLVGKATVEVVYLQLFKPVKPEERRVILGRHASTFGDVAPGLKMAIRVDVPDMTLTGVPDDALQVTRFTDDFKTDLGSGKQTPSRMGSMLRERNLPLDGRSCILEIGSDKLPAPGATRIVVQGTATVRCGTGERTVEQKDFAIAMGKIVTAGEMHLRIAGMGESTRGDGGEGGVRLTFSSDSPIDLIKSIDFLATDGTKLRGRMVTRNTEMAGRAAEQTFDYVLSTSPDKATVRVTTFEKVSLVAVPIDVSTGVGF